MLTLLLSLFLISASASENACVECCQQNGLISCPTQVRMFGAGSVASPESGGWRVIGLWWLSCTGDVRFEPGGTVVIDHEPRSGEILRLAYPPATVSCFGRHCALPSGACMVAMDNGQNFVVADCQSNQPLTAERMRVRGPVAVQINQNGQSIIADSNAQAPINSVRVATQARPLNQNTIDISIKLPAPPSGACNTSDLLRAQSRRQQEEGDQALVENQVQTAADKYLAALTMDSCNAFAWHALGQLSIRGGHLDSAVQALRVATRLVPSHYGAFTSLGEAYERNQRFELASDAYHMALSIHPQHLPALEGLARIESPR